MPVSYRIPLFKILSRKHNLKLFLTRTNKSKYKKNLPNTRILSSLPIPFMSRYSEDAYGSPEIPYSLFYYLLKEGYDVIIAKNLNSISTYIALLASRIKRKPFIIWEETWYLGLGLLRKILYTLSTFLLRNSNAIVVSGSKSKEYIISYGVDIKKIFIAPNASLSYSYVNEEKLQVVLHQLNLENTKVILYLGRLIKRKGVEYLINAFKIVQENMKNCTLLIAGSGCLKLELQKICQKLDLNNVHFLGYVTEDFKRILYSISDVFVLPSIKTDGLSEVWGLTVNEAMSSGTPVICTDAVGAAYDLILDGINGYIIKEKDYKNLAKAILNTIADNQVTIKMGISSKEIINSGFTYEIMAEGFFKAIDYALKGI